MKPILYLLLAIFFFVEINDEAFALNANADTTLKTKLILNDSGFVTKEMGWTLLSDYLTDTTLANFIGITIECIGVIYVFDTNIVTATENVTTDIYWQNYQQTDTIGKYYRKGESNHYIMCLVDPASLDEHFFENYIIIEVDAEGKLLKNEDFNPHYWRCWSDNAFNGFSKYGDFFGIEICDGGMGWSSSDLYLFKEVTPQDSITPIFLSGYFGIVIDMPNFYLNYYPTSMEIKENEVIINYYYERNNKKGKLAYKGNLKIRYFYENGKWSTKDKNKLKKICF